MGSNMAMPQAANVGAQLADTSRLLDEARTQAAYFEEQSSQSQAMLQQMQQQLQQTSQQIGQIAKSPGMYGP
jgi:hypothetical protein